MAVATACLATLVGLNYLLGPFLFPTSFALDMLSVIAGAYVIGGFANTPRDGLVGGAIYGGVGVWLGTLVAIPLGAALVGRTSPDVMGVAIMVGFLFGCLYAIIFGIIGAVAGYVGARLRPRAN